MAGIKRASGPRRPRDLEKYEHPHLVANKLRRIADDIDRNNKDGKTVMKAAVRLWFWQRED